MQHGGVHFADACVTMERLRRALGWGLSAGGLPDTVEPVWSGTGDRWRVEALPSWAWTLADTYTRRLYVMQDGFGHGWMQWL